MGGGHLCAQRLGQDGTTPWTGRLRIAAACVWLTSLLASATAGAAPITYYFDSGSADITATAGATTVVDTTISLDGAFVTFDDAIPEVVGFSITAPQSLPISMLSPYGGYDTFVIESAAITPGVGFTNYSAMSTGVNTWSFVVGPVDIAGVYSASHTSGLPLPVMNLPVPFTDSSFLSGSINTDTMTFELLGITLAQLDGSDFGEADDLIIKADITWTGVVPEPGTATLLGCGLAMLAARRRSTITKRVVH